MNREPADQREAVARRIGTGTAMCLDDLIADIEADANDAEANGERQSGD